MKHYTTKDIASAATELNIPKDVAENICILREIEQMILEAYRNNEYHSPYISDYVDNFYMEFDDFVEFEDDEDEDEDEDED